MDESRYIKSVDELEPIAYQWRYKDTAFEVALLMSGDWVAEYKPLVGGQWLAIVDEPLPNAQAGFDAVVDHINRRIESGDF